MNKFAVAVVVGLLFVGDAKAEEIQDFIKKCEQKDGEACYTAAASIALGLGGKRDFQKVAIYFQKACDLGEESGCFALGHLYLDGKGVKQNFSTAQEYFNRACDLGRQDGCSAAKEATDVQNTHKRLMVTLTRPLLPPLVTMVMRMLIHSALMLSIHNGDTMSPK